jgi:hypothetical protein
MPGEEGFAMRAALKRLVGTLVILSALAGPLAAEDGVEEGLIRQTVETYLHGLKFNDVESFKKAFYPEAKLFFVKKDGTLGQLTQEQWYKGFAASAGKEEQGTLKIVALDRTETAASVKVFEDYPTSTYTDYISLLKFDGEWKIVNKIFVGEKKPASPVNSHP